MRAEIGITMLTVAAGFAVRAAPSAGYSLRLAHRPWVLVLPLAGFTIDGEDVDPDGSKSRVLAHDERTGLVVSAYLEVQEHPMTSWQCRGKYWPMIQQSPMTKKNVRTMIVKQQARGEYFVESIEGKPVRQQSVNAFIGIDGTCADVHVSKAGFNGTKDRAVIDALLDGVRKGRVRKGP